MNEREDEIRHTRVALWDATLTAGQKHIKGEIRLRDVTDSPTFHPHVTFGIMVLFLAGEAHLWWDIPRSYHSAPVLPSFPPPNPTVNKEKASSHLTFSCEILIPGRKKAKEWKIIHSQEIKNTKPSWAGRNNFLLVHTATRTEKSLIIS